MVVWCGGGGGGGGVAVGRDEKGGWREAGGGGGIATGVWYVWCSMILVRVHVPCTHYTIQYSP